VLTHLPPSDLPKTHVSDKLAHFAVYALLGTLLGIAIGRRWSWLGGAVVVTTIGLIYGAIDELTQPLFGRSCSIHDWYADAAGVVFGAILGNLGRIFLEKYTSSRKIPVT